MSVHSGKADAERPVLAAPAIRDREGSASCGTNLDLRELQGSRQLPPLRGAQVLLALEGLLQAADLLGGEGGARPPLPPAGPARLRGPAALRARALALVARGLVRAEPAAVGGCTGGKGAAVRPLATAGAAPPPPFSPVAPAGAWIPANPQPAPPSFPLRARSLFTHLAPTGRGRGYPGGALGSAPPRRARCPRAGPAGGCPVEAWP